MRIGELARRTEVEAGTLRAWERRFGLLQPTRTKGGQRQYSEADVARVLTVRRLMDDGLTLAAAAERVVDAGDGGAPSEPETRLLQQILQTLDEGILVGKDARTRYANRRAAQILGCSVDELLGRSILDFIPTEELRDARGRVADLRQGMVFEPFDQRIRRDDGSTVIIEAHVRPMFDRAGRYEGSVSIMRDVTQQRTAEALERKRDDDLRLRDLRASAIAVLGARAVGEGQGTSGHTSLMHETLEAARRLLNADRARILEIAEDGKLAVRAALPEDEPATIPPGSGSLAGYAVLAGRTVIVDDVATERRFDTSTLAPGMRSAAAAPIFGRGGVRGVLGAQSVTLGLFDTAAADFLQSLANVVAAALK